MNNNEVNMENLITSVATTSVEAKTLSTLEMANETNKMREIIVLPALEILESEKIRPQDLNANLNEFTQFIYAKTKECRMVRILKKLYFII